MKKLLTLGLLPFLLISCTKKTEPAPACTDVLPSTEEAAMIAYCTDNSIVYTKDPSGIFYQILDPGTAPHPATTSTITVNYVGKFLDGTILDQSTAPYTNKLNSLIQAWQIALPFIGKGGHIKMVAPSSLCYGCEGYPGTVDPNTILFFEVTLVDVQ